MHVVLNMAASLDGRVAGPAGQPVRLSGPEDVERVHRLRAASDAIAVGAGTVRADDPRLTVRHPRELSPAQQPLRVVLTASGELPAKARVFDDAADTLVLTTDAGASPQPTGAEVVAGPQGKQPRGVELAWALDELADRGVEQLLLEGGPMLAASALAEGLVDRFHLYVAPRLLGTGPSLAQAFEGLSLELTPRARGPLGEGTLISYGVAP